MTIVSTSTPRDLRPSSLELETSPMGGFPDPSLAGGLDATLCRTLPGLLLARPDLFGSAGGPSAFSDEWAALKKPGMEDVFSGAVPGFNQKGHGAAGKSQAMVLDCSGKVQPKADLEEKKKPKKGSAEDGKPTGTPAQPKQSKGNPLVSSTVTDAQILEPSAGKVKGSQVGDREVSHWSSGGTLDQTGAWARSKDYARVGDGKVALQGYGEAGAGAQGKVTNEKDLGRAGTLTENGVGTAGTEARGYGQINWGVGGYNLQGGGQAKVGAFGDGSLNWTAQPAFIDIGGYRLNVTPSANVKGGTVVGAETGGTMFFGAAYPTSDEAAKGILPRYGAELQGNAFLGAKVDGTLIGGFGGNNVGVNGGLMAGVGLEGKAKVERQGSRLSVEFGAGAALGLGASLGFKLDLNFQPLLDGYHAVKDVFSKTSPKKLFGG